jgi:hypothetical protein
VAITATEAASLITNVAYYYPSEIEAILDALRAEADTIPPAMREANRQRTAGFQRALDAGEVGAALPTRG